LARQEVSDLKSGIAIIGAGIGGLATAIAFRRIGLPSTIYEQSSAFERVGAAINMTPNAVKILDGLGVGNAIREKSHTPNYRISRTWDTGKETSRIELGQSAVKRYGVAPLMLHRADLMAILESSVPVETVKFNKKLESIREADDNVQLLFEDKTIVKFRGVVGADGVHSVVRESLFGIDKAIYTGMSAYRTIIPAKKVCGYDVLNFVKWWGPVPESQVVTNAINKGKELFLFASMPEQEEIRESWSMKGDVKKIREYFSGYHKDIRSVLNSVTEIDRTALYEREPLNQWSRGRITLLGDACHAMVPFMAQGAAMGLEDAVILSRCAETYPKWSEALKHYEMTRIPRASKIQRGSHENEWLRKPGNPDWVYGFDAWSENIL